MQNKKNKNQTNRQFEGVRSVAVHMTPAVWSAAVREEEHHLVQRLGPKREEIPDHIWVLMNES